ncbi:hypothetical protein [Corynebacterium stationis]|uniref:hypothetical protein n=1 Tax=Corynebacterium stationis TaxID=1705 RepID=UPI00263B80D4|nr:hypothetical protein [Corynebacterium stationis]
MNKVQEVWETWLEVTDRIIKVCATIALLNLTVQILASFQQELRIDSILHAAAILALFMGCTYYQGLYAQLKAANNEAD